MVIFHSYVNVYQRVHLTIRWQSLDRVTVTEVIVDSSLHLMIFEGTV
jgi:hypothetical protein